MMLKSGDSSSGVIDKDDKIFVSKLDTFGFGKRKDFMDFVSFGDDGTENREITKKYEKSFGVCLWHYFNSPEKESSNVEKREG